jgi:hypothetical protein
LLQSAKKGDVLQMKELIRSDELLYILEEDEQQTLFLGVLCGGVGVYEVRIRLTDEEREEYLAQGRDFLDRLSLDVAKDHERFKDRIVWR